MEVDEEQQGKLVKEALRADSVAVLLGQALQAQDRALLERCRPRSCMGIQAAASMKGTELRRRLCFQGCGKLVLATSGVLDWLTS